MSRTSLSIKNSQIALLFYVIEMFLGFFSRKAFITHIGVEVLGLNTTANNLLQFLNLAELGIGSAVAFVLYKPLAQQDEKAIKEIIQVQGWLYKRIANIILIGAILLMFFFPIIFQKSDLPIWYAYASFGVLLYGALLTYYINFKQIVLSASQKDYKITLNYKSVIIIKNIIQILAISYLSNGYIWWLFLQFIFSTLASINLNRTIKKEYPFLQKLDTKVPLELRKKYDIIIVKVKQLFFHKVSSYILNQTSPLIIYGFTSLTLVAIYGNYMLIVGGVTMLLQAIFNSVAAGVGNLIAQGEKQQIIKVFKELFTSRFLCVCIFIFCIYKLINPFIILWIGEKYLLDNSTLVVILAIMYINLTRSVVDNFIFGYGLFKDIWAPLIESFLNISLSISLGYFWGITGILSGVLISLIIIVLIWKPIFLFKYGIKEQFSIYIKMYIKHLGVCIIAYILTNNILNLINFTPQNFIEWSIYSLITFFSITIVLFSLLYIFTSEMKIFAQRCKSILHFIKK